MMKVRATHFIGIKEKVPGEDAKVRLGKDLLVIRRGEERTVSKKEMELLQKEAAGKFKIIEEEKQDNGRQQTTDNI